MEKGYIYTLYTLDEYFILTYLYPSFIYAMTERVSVRSYAQYNIKDLEGSCNLF